MTKLYSYRELKEVPLNIIFAKYATKDLNLLQFRQRIYSGNMSMEEALNKKSFTKPNSFTSNKYIDTLYTKLEKEVEQAVTKQNFILRMSRGYAPLIAIQKKKTLDKKRNKSKNQVIKESLAELKKQEAKERKEESKRLQKRKQWSKNEKVYLKNITLLNEAFSKVTS